MSLLNRVRDAAIKDISRYLGVPDSDITAVESQAIHRPNLSLLHPDLGLIAVEVGRPQETDSAVRARLNDKVLRLLREATYLNDQAIRRISIIAGSSRAPKRFGPRAVLLGEWSLADFDWTCELALEPPEDFDFAKVNALLLPKLIIEIPRYSGVEDSGYLDRQRQRIELDAAQLALASREIEDVLVVSGGPGTGKTLVLLGRAKWLAEQHPEWKILFVVYNNLLARHLRSVPGLPKSIRVVTLKRFLEARGAKSLAKTLMDWNDPDGAELQAAKIVKETVFEEDDIDIDALLVDEWQDFRAPYIRYLLSVLRNGRGGAMFAGDEKQAIYTFGYPTPFGRRKVESVGLNRPYRSTQQILKVAMALDRNFEIRGVKHAPTGQPVTAIYAPHWNLQGEAIALEIRHLLKTSAFRPGDIAVLCTTSTGANHVVGALERHSIPLKVLTKFWEITEPGGDEVNVMTIHGSKGQGFPVVFLQGFETLKDADGTSERQKWRRVGFVGVTRAEDLLYIVYKDVTQFVSDLLDLAEATDPLVIGRVFPDDYADLM